MAAHIALTVVALGSPQGPGASRSLPTPVLAPDQSLHSVHPCPHVLPPGKNTETGWRGTPLCPGITWLRPEGWWLTNPCSLIPPPMKAGVCPRLSRRLPPPDILQSKEQDSGSHFCTRRCVWPWASPFSFLSLRFHFFFHIIGFHTFFPPLSLNSWGEENKKLLWKVNQQKSTGYKVNQNGFKIPELLFWNYVASGTRINCFCSFSKCFFSISLNEVSASSMSFRGKALRWDLLSTK